MRVSLKRLRGAAVAVRSDVQIPSQSTVKVPPRRPEQPVTATADASGGELPRLVSTAEAARFLGRSPNTLKRWRYEGVGPDYVVIQGRVSYDMAVLLGYVQENTRVPSVRAAMEASREAL